MTPQQLVTAIHSTPTRLVLALAGGGSRAASELLEVPGASRTVLEAAVPYSSGAMANWLGGKPDQFCSSPTARAMAMAAFRRAVEYGEGDEQVAGVACTASLATDRPKRGAHRAHVSLQASARTAVFSLELVKGQRTRAEEERLVAAMVLNVVADVCGLDARLDLELGAEEKVETAQKQAPGSWQGLLAGSLNSVRHGGRPDLGHRDGQVIFPGAFHPLHRGHRRMAEVAARVLGRPVEFEDSILNVEKPPLDYLEIDERLAQFTPEQAVWLTRAAMFEEKSRLFPGATFVVGTDTLRRIADVRYYGDAAAMQRALDRIAGRGCRFLVFGRLSEPGFVELGDLLLPEVLMAICEGVSADQFREDVSSRAIRAGERD